MKSAIKVFLPLFLLIGTIAYAADTASILPPAKTTFVDQNGKPLTSGTVDFYIPSTTTRKATWQDASETILNTNPVVLDAAGRGLILGSGAYRQVVKDRNGNIVWDQVTSSAGSGGSASSATGDGDLVGTVKPWAGLTAPNQYVFSYGQELLRATYPALFTALTSTQAIFCTSGSPILTGFANTSNFPEGADVEVSCLAAGRSTIISKNAVSITLAANANLTTNTNALVLPWGGGNHSTTFNLPDFRGIVPIGNNVMGGVISAHLDRVGFNGSNPNSIGGYGGSSGTVLTTSFLPPYTPSGSITNGAITSTTTSTGSTNTTTAVTAAGHNFADVGPIISINSTQAASTFTGTAQGGTSTRFTNTPAGVTINFIIKITPDANSATASGVTSLGGMTGSIACGSGTLCTGNVISLDATFPLPTNKGGTGVTSATFNFITAAPYNACTGADDSAAFQTAINDIPSSGGVIDIPPGVICNLSTVLDFKGHNNLKLRGYGGEGGGNVTPSIIHWNGTGARALDFRDSIFNEVSSLALYNTNAAFSGFLIDTGAVTPGVTPGSSGFVLKDTTIGSNFIGTSGCLNISEGIEAVVESNNFSRCSPAIKGQNVLSLTTLAKIRNNQFASQTGASIIDCGEAWYIESNAFEGDVNGNANAFSNNSARPCRNINFISNWFGDAIGVDAGHTQIILTATGANIVGNSLQSNALTTLVTLDGGSGYSISANYMNQALVGVNCVNSPTGGRVNSNTIVGVATPISGTCVDFNWENNNPNIIPAGTGYVTLDTAQTITGVKTFGSAGAVGRLKLAGNTSGTTILDASTIASGILTLPAATDTLVGKATTDVLTNKSVSGSTNTLSNIGNSSLTNSATTVNGQTCTLGSTCTVTASATSTTVGTTTVLSGTTLGILYNNAGVLGNTAAGTNGQLFLGVTSSAPNWGTMSGDATISNSGALTLASILSAGGPTGSATASPIITYDAKGRLTAVSSATITPAASSITSPAALTKVDDTNVTLTLGGSPTIALLAGTSITAGWTGTLANARLATMATNTVKGNATSGTASPTDLLVGTCSTAASALIWTTNTGFGCNTSITAATVPASGLTGQVALTNGGTAANLTASNGGLFYSTASAGAILSGTATARQMLQSGPSAAPAWSTTTWPATTTVNRILWSSAANVISDLTTANSSLLVTDGSGVPSLSTVIPNGVTVTTQSQADASNKPASTSYTDAAVAAKGTAVLVTPVWSGNNTAPTLGNGTLTASVVRVGPTTVIASIKLISGTTTTYGTSTFWTFTLPAPYNGVATAFNSGNSHYYNNTTPTDYYSQQSIQLVGANTVFPLYNGAFINSSTPFVWAGTGNIVEFSMILNGP